MKQFEPHLPTAVEMDEMYPKSTIRKEEAVNAARNATLPVGFRWGDDAMEQFNYGKERAAQAVEALPADTSNGVDQRDIDIIKSYLLRAQADATPKEFERLELLILRLTPNATWRDKAASALRCADQIATRINTVKDDSTRMDQIGRNPLGR